jgi:hypothetical protein
LESGGSQQSFTKQTSFLYRLLYLLEPLLELALSFFLLSVLGFTSGLRSDPLLSLDGLDGFTTVLF